jgi:hypothetical protein
MHGGSSGGGGGGGGGSAEAGAGGLGSGGASGGAAATAAAEGLVVGASAAAGRPGYGAVSGGDVFLAADGSGVVTLQLHLGAGALALAGRCRAALVLGPGSGKNAPALPPVCSSEGTSPLYACCVACRRACVALCLSLPLPRFQASLRSRSSPAGRSRWAAGEVWPCAHARRMKRWPFLLSVWPRCICRSNVHTCIGEAHR